MSRKKSFIAPLTDTERASLVEGKNNGKSSSFRNRCHAVLLSEKGFEISVLQKIFGVQRSTIHNWFKRWREGGIEELKTRPGQGRKPKLSIDNEEHIKVVKTAVKDYAEKGTNLLAQIEQELGMEEELSMKILRPFLKKLTIAGNA